MRLLAFLLLAAGPAAAQWYGQPEQIHISYGGSPTKMFITWVTLSDIQESTVQYGQSKLNRHVSGNVTKFVDGGSMHRQLYIHRVLLDNLEYGTTYVYRVGGRWGWSNLYYFKTLPRNSTTGYRFGVYGDLGNENAVSLPYIQNEAQMGNFDMILHNGDFAYDMYELNATRADQFFRQIEPIAAYVPYMGCAGNHEESYNFSNYVNRFTFPNTNANRYYSFDVGPAHIIFFDTEFYFYTEYGTQQIANQYQWLEKDLAAAQANRDLVPWIVVLGHRAMYCSDSWNKTDCTLNNSIIRDGMPPDGSYALEPLWNAYGVDLGIFAHCHFYERIYPIYNFTMYKGATEPYTDPAAMTQIITGAAGNREDHSSFSTDPQAWSAERNDDYGYSRMHIYNSTHLYFEQLSTEQSGAVVDSFWLVQHYHGPFGARQATTKGESVRHLFNLGK